MFGEHKLKKDLQKLGQFGRNHQSYFSITTNVKTLFPEKIANEPSHDILVLIDGPTYPVHIYIQRMEVDE